MEGIDMPTTVETSNISINSAHKIISILDILADAKIAPSLLQLSTQLELSKNATLKIVKPLESKGIIVQNKQNSTYTLGINSVTLAQKILRNVSVITYAHPILEELVNRHDEAAYLTVLNDGEVLFLDMVDCEQQIKTTSLIGKRFPFFSNAAGKVMKCLDSCDTLLRKKGRPKEGTPNLEQLNNELSEIRKKGVAIDKGGLGEEVISVAVAIKDYSGKVIGAITMIGPSFRMLADRIETEIIPSLLEKADVLSNKFGYVKSYA